ncbi:MAG: Tfp pilus assembly protein PilF, partial [Woeseiaceae bacterium]
MNVEEFRQQINELLALYNHGKLQEALLHGEAMAERYPNEPTTANLLGAINLGLGRPEQAADSYRRALKIKPDLAETHSNLGDVLRISGRTEEAAASYQRALQFKPDLVIANNNLGAALIDLGKPDKAVASLTRALQIEPDLADAHNNLAMALNDLGKPEEAAASLSRALKINPDFAEAHNNLGTTLNDLGKPEEAIASYNKALQINPEYAKAHRFLSTIKNYRDGDPQIQQMLQLLEQDDLRDEDRTDLNFALAKAYEDTDNFDGAFSCLTEGNRLRKAELNYDFSVTWALFVKIKAAFAQANPVLSAPDDSEHGKPQQPIFILGMPRSGTTLVEQILASHSQVFGGGELALLSQSVNAMEWQTSQLSATQLQFVRNSYHSGLTEIGATEPYITDKMPANFLSIGFIISALPEAKIIHVKRDARATCWSNYKHYFSGNFSNFTYDLQDVC